MLNNRSFVIILLIAIFILGGVLYIYNPDPVEYGSDEEPVFCTADAKLCPDGSYVGRRGPNCEFDPCPEGLSPTSTPIFEDGTIME